MKITFGILTLCKGGAQRMLAELINGLHRKGHQIEVIMPSYGVVDYPVEAKVTKLNKTTIVADDYPRSDIIISSYYSLVLEAEKASQRNGKHIRISLCYEPVLFEEQASSFTSYQLTKNLVVLSKWHKDLIQLIHGIEGKIVPVGISDTFSNLNIRDPNQTHIGVILRRFDVENWHRQQEYLLHVLLTIKRKYPKTVLHLITPPTEYHHSKYLQKLKHMKQFKFHLPKNDEELNNIYNKLHIFVNSSIYDTASLPGLEAMKCGAALVTLYNGGNLDYTKHKKNSLVSYAYDPKLIEHIEHLILEPKIRNRIAKQGTQEAALWTWDKSVESLEAYIKTIK